MLHIVCPMSQLYKPNIEKLCQAAGITQYEILNPMSHDLDRAFNSVLVLGDFANPKMTYRHFWQTDPPESEMSRDDKMRIFEVFKTIGEHLSINAEKTEINTDDIPELTQLADYLNGHVGQVYEIMLDDGRILGIYPDGEKLQRKYEVEFHASTVVNVSKLKEIFDVRKITIKEN